MRVMLQELLLMWIVRRSLGRISAGTTNAPPGRMDHDHSVSDKIIGCAIEVHRTLGPGLLERPYLLAMCVELRHCGLSFECEPHLYLTYRSEPIGAYIPDLIVERTVIVEVKSVANLDPIFTAQLITYLRMTKLRVGLLVNFNRPKLVDGLKRVVL